MVAARRRTLGGYGGGNSRSAAPSALGDRKQPAGRHAPRENLPRTTQDLPKRPITPPFPPPGLPQACFCRRTRPPDLADLARRLAALPEAVRAEIVTMIKAAQAIMRHSDINLTMGRYSHVLVEQAGDAVAALPDLSLPATETASATGTDGNSRLALCLALSGGPKQTSADGRRTEGGTRRHQERIGKCWTNLQFSKRIGGGGGIRTHEIWRFCKPLP